MGSIASVISALNAAGIPADRANPNRKLPNIGKSVAAVMLESRDYSTNTDVVRVIICSPSALGGGKCEDAAKSAGEALAKIKRSGWKTVCTQDACTFDGPSDQYQIQIKVTFSPELFLVTINGKTVEGATEFSAWKETDTKGADLEGAAEQENPAWNVRLDENIRCGIKETSGETSGFRVTVTRESGVDVFENCSWSSVERMDGDHGLRQIRTGTAVSRSYTAK